MPTTPRKSTFTVGQRIAYAKLFLKNTGTPATDDSWRRRGTVVAIAGTVHPAYTHWKTNAPMPLGEDFVLITWDDDPEVKLIRNETIAGVGSAKFAEDI